MSVEDHCMRCQRSAEGDPAPFYWEVSEDEAGVVLGVVCPDCFTPTEIRAIDGDCMDLEDAFSKCSRCLKERPEMPPGDVLEDHGWYLDGESSLVCVECLVPVDIDEQAALSRRAKAIIEEMRDEGDYES